MRRIQAILALPALLCLVAAGAWSQEAPTSILWAGTAVEHRGALIQAYSTARSELDKALRDRNWTAAIEQEGSKFQSLPPAIVMDLDETVFDNSPFEAQRALAGASYSETIWTTWAEAGRAAPLPGALAFTIYARSRGVEVIYVTNRDAALKKATRANLERDGFPLDPKADTLYCKGEKPEWTSDKGTRRAEIARRYRILLLFGDDLGDFMSGAANTVERRRELSARYDDRWGTKWIVLPNAMYGSWENSLALPSASPTGQQQREAALRYLRQIAESPAAGAGGK